MKPMRLADGFRLDPGPDFDQLMETLQANIKRLSERAVRPAQRAANVRSAASLAVRWREEATVLERRGAADKAQLLRGAADELDAALEAERLAELTLEQAEVESGYTRRGLEKMIARGDLANVGRNGAPRVRRCDLPRKPTASEPEPVDVTSILERRRG